MPRSSEFCSLLITPWVQVVPKKVNGTPLRQENFVVATCSALGKKRAGITARRLLPSLTSVSDMTLWLSLTAIISFYGGWGSRSFWTWISRKIIWKHFASSHPSFCTQHSLMKHHDWSLSEKEPSALLLSCLSVLWWCVTGFFWFLCCCFHLNVLEFKLCPCVSSQLRFPQCSKNILYI